MHTEAPPRTHANVHLNQFIDLLPDPVFLVNDRGHIVFASTACTEVLGYDTHELTGRAMLDLVMPDDIDKTVKEAAEVIAKGRSDGFENRYLRKDGRHVHLMWSARWLPVERLHMSVARDISHLRDPDKLSRMLVHASAPLARHEQRVLQMLLTDASEKQIADRLGLSFSTTHSYVTGIFRKFRVRGRAGLMSLWIEHA